MAGNLLFVEQTAPLRRPASHLLWAAHLLYEAAPIVQRGRTFYMEWHALYTGWPAQTCFGELSPSRPPARNSLRQSSVRGTHAAVPTATSPLPLRRGYKKRPAVSHDRSLILLMVSDKRTRDVNSRMKIRSCATNDLRLPNEPLKSEFEIGCCKYSLSRYFHQNLSDFFSTAT